MELGNKNKLITKEIKKEIIKEIPKEFFLQEGSYPPRVSDAGGFVYTIKKEQSSKEVLKEYVKKLAYPFVMYDEDRLTWRSGWNSLHSQ